MDRLVVGGAPATTVTYDYFDNDLIYTITEMSALDEITTTFTYDSRGRLVGEVRTGEDGYDFEYEYDQGGNRTRKVRNLPGITGDYYEWVYHYDVDDLDTYATPNNRLMVVEYYEKVSFQQMGPMGPMGFGGGGCQPVLVSTTWYEYNDFANVEGVQTEYENAEQGQKQFHGTRLYYAANGEVMTGVVGNEWNVVDEEIDEYVVNYGREFRYDGARQRYMVRELDADELTNYEYEVVSTTWTDYDGDEPYGDFTVTPGNPPTVTDLRSFELGIGVVDPWTNNGEDDTKYFHTDHLGTTRFMSADAGATSGVATYTAFGERVSGSDHRYGYAGAWGYQGTLDDQTPPAAVFPFLHLGHRYYDPSTGRFLQCDPIGIWGGFNVYVYAYNSPLFHVDPSGLGPRWDKIKK